jgi:ubiquinol-cytochrome c reductase cytochrome c1 subunit
VNRILLLFFTCFCAILLALPLVSTADTAPHLEKVVINLQDKPSLQRGARLFINYCMGCHSLNYMRYNQVAKDLGILNANGQIDEPLVKQSFIFTGDKIADTMRNAMPPELAKQWFGVVPPDLTLEAKVRGADWLYTFLRSFYQDPSRPWGSNNLLFPAVNMPDVLAGLQGIQFPVYRTNVTTADSNAKLLPVIDHLVLVEAGTMPPDEFESAMTDLVNFLVYVSDPTESQRHHIGIWVLLFLIVFSIVTYLLKREYWKNI